MKLNHVAVGVLTCLGLTAYAAELNVSSADLDHARVYLQQTQDLVVGATKGLSKEQWNFKPSPDRWSIAEIVEHVVVVQDYFLGPIRESLSKAAAGPERDYQREDELVINQMPDRTRKFHAPDILVPTGRWTAAESMDRLLKNYVELRNYLETTPDLRQHAVDLLPVKALSKGAYSKIDGYQAILLVAAHAERHTKQILEVKAESSFPAK